MVQSRGGKTEYPARWVTRGVTKPTTMRTKGSYIPLILPRMRMMQSNGQTNHSPGSVGIGNVFLGRDKPPELQGMKHPLLLQFAACDPTTRV